MSAQTHDEARYHYQLRFRVEGRVRFLSHLETVDVLLSALRRSGVALALSRGMRPKPLVKMAMPRPVGVEAWSDIVEVELQQQVDPEELSMQLSAVLPAGIVLQQVVQLGGAYSSAASRVAGATFRVVVDGATPEELEHCVEQFRIASQVLVERVTPKRRRTVDVRAVVGEVAALPGEGTVRFYTRLTEEGSARPDEVVRALGSLGGCELQPRHVIRESITLTDAAGVGRREVEPALVGAEVPAGPDKPWGAC